MWAQGMSALIGVWLMAAPGVFGFGGPAATNAHIVGPFIAALSVIAMAECTRGVRRANLLLGLWLVLAPLFLTHSTEAAVNSVMVGAAVGVLSFVRGRMSHQFGGGWSALWRSRRGGDTRASGQTKAGGNHTGETRHDSPATPDDHHHGGRRHDRLSPGAAVRP